MRDLLDRLERCSGPPSSVDTPVDDADEDEAFVARAMRRLATCAPTDGGEGSKGGDV